MQTPSSGILSGNVALDPVEPGPATESAKHRIFLRVGLDFHRGLELLSAMDDPPLWSRLLLAGQAAESYLKALLSHAGITEAKLKKKALGHDLVALWNEAASLQLVDAAVPDWLTELSELHSDPNFTNRYPTKLCFLGSSPVVLPGLDDLRTTVKSALGN